MIDPNDIFLVDGNISCLEINGLTVPHLTKLKRDDFFKTIFSEAKDGVQIAEKPMILNAADGDYRQNFVCLLDDQLITGNFFGAQWLKEGNHIKAAVSKKDKDLYVHGIIDKEEGLLWCVDPRGARVCFAHNLEDNINYLKFMIYFYLLAFIILLIIDDYNYSLISFYGMFVLGNLILFAFFHAWTYYSYKEIETISTRIFKLFELKDPSNINLSGYCLYFTHVCGDYYKNNKLKTYEHLTMGHEIFADVYYYEKALKDGKIKMVS
jgi:hypothetical protein